MFRAPQMMASFEPGEPASGYYTDLRAKASAHGDPHAASLAFRALTARRASANPVSIAQVGLGAWQLAAVDPAWLDIAEAAAVWVAGDLDDRGRLAYLFPMPHTFALDPPWYSAMAQGEAASLLVRVAHSTGSPGLLDAAARAIGPLLDESSGLVVSTPQGPVLQEYPTTPPAHALNGWIFALWGLYDAGLAVRGDGAAVRDAFAAGATALARRLPLYHMRLGWSRYDLFPHRVTNAASPFYHRLHVEQLRALARLAPDHRAFAETAERWQTAARSPLPLGYGLVRKALFRTAERRRPIR